MTAPTTTPATAAAALSDKDAPLAPVAYDPAKAQAFGERTLADMCGMITTILGAFGDELGLWKDLHARGPATSVELARRLGLSERHVREWLGAMTVAGYLEYEPATRRFRLPPEHAATLADEGGPMFVGGALQAFAGFMRPLDRIIDTFRTGGGVPQSAYPDATYEGQARFTRPWYEHQLVPSWIPAAGLGERLAAGIDVCDVGCGRGRALIKLAQEFPRSRYVGYDAFGPNVDRARAAAEAAGVGDRVRFEQRDAADMPEAGFDLLTTFDVVHDAVDPVALLKGIRRALRPGGVYLCLEMAAAPRLEDNVGPLGVLLYGCSILYCMTTSLAHGGAGLGTCGVHETKLRELADEVGFRTVRRLPIDNPFNHLYELRSE